MKKQSFTNITRKIVHGRSHGKVEGLPTAN